MWNGSIKPNIGSQLQLGHPINSGLVGCWLMNEGSGTRVWDSSGNGNVGTFSGDAVTWVSGAYGSAINFGGTSDFITCGTPTSVRITGPMTCLAWGQLTSDNNAYNHIVARGNGFSSLQPWSLSWNSNLNRVYVFARNLDNSAGVSDYISKTYDTNWHIFGFVFNGTTLQAYCDGTYSTGVALNGIYDSADRALAIGSDDLSGYEWNGNISHVMLYNRALAANEISQLYRTPFVGFWRSCIKPWTAAMAGGAPPATTTGYMTLNKGWWG